MATTKICDCCGTTSGVRSAVLTTDGIHEPKPVRRQDGFKHQAVAVDLCGGCITSLQFKWLSLAGPTTEGENDA